MPIAVMVTTKGFKNFSLSFKVVYYEKCNIHLIYSAYAAYFF